MKEIKEDMDQLETLNQLIFLFHFPYKKVKEFLIEKGLDNFWFSFFIWSKTFLNHRSLLESDLNRLDIKQSIFSLTLNINSFIR